MKKPTLETLQEIVEDLASEADFGSEDCRYERVRARAFGEAAELISECVPGAIDLKDQLVAALEEAEQALADIINAAGNGQPYTAAELGREMIPYVDQARAALAAAKKGGPA